MTLLDVPQDRPSKRQQHAAEVAELKAKHGIVTHLCRGGGEWLAVCPKECGKVLGTPEDITLFDLISGYCRLLDEAGLVEENHPTEHAAVTALAKRLEGKP